MVFAIFYSYVSSNSKRRWSVDSRLGSWRLTFCFKRFLVSLPRVGAGGALTSAPIIELQTIPFSAKSGCRGGKVDGSAVLDKRKYSL